MFNISDSDDDSSSSCDDCDEIEGQSTKSATKAKLSRIEPPPPTTQKHKHNPKSKRKNLKHIRDSEQSNSDEDDDDDDEEDNNSYFDDKENKVIICDSRKQVFPAKLEGSITKLALNKQQLGANNRRSSHQHNKHQMHIQQQQQHNNLSKLINSDKQNLSQFSRSSVGGSKYLLTCHPNQPDIEDLIFESRFESGNLAKAVKITSGYYELYLRPDMYTNRHTQWFYFRVTNTRKNVNYR